MLPKILTKAQRHEKLKELTRGQRINADIMAKFMESLEIPQDAKDLLLEMTPASYIGNAIEQTKRI